MALPVEEFQKIALQFFGHQLSTSAIRTGKPSKTSKAKAKTTMPKPDLKKTTLDPSSTADGMSQFEAVITRFINDGAFTLPSKQATIADFTEVAKTYIKDQLKKAPGVRVGDDFESWWVKFTDTHLVQQLRSFSLAARSTAACALIASVPDSKWMPADDKSRATDRGLTFHELATLPQLFMRQSPVAEFVAGLNTKCVPEAVKFTTDDEDVRKSFTDFIRNAQRPPKSGTGKGKNINVCGVRSTDTGSTPHSGSTVPDADTYICQLVYKSSAHFEAFTAFIRSLTTGNSVSKVIKGLSTVFTLIQAIHMMSACGVAATAIALGFAEETYDAWSDSEDEEEDGMDKSKPAVVRAPRLTIGKDGGEERLAKDAHDHEATRHLYSYVARLAIDAIQGAPEVILGKTFSRPPKQPAKKRARTDSS